MSKKQETTPIVQPTAELPAELAGTWGAGENLTSDDIVIPKILQMQAISKLVTEEKAAAGDWINNADNTIICKKDKPLGLVIFNSYKNIIVSTKGKNDNKYSFKEYIAATPENVLLPWEEEDKSDVFGGWIKRNLQYNYFCLLANDPMRVPFILSLSSTKVKTAKKLNTMFTTLSQVLKKPSAAYVFNFQSVKETGDKGTWIAADVSQGEATPTETLALARHWYDTLAKSKFTVVEDESEHATEVAAVQSTAPEQDEGYIDSLQA